MIVVVKFDCKPEFTIVGDSNDLKVCQGFSVRNIASLIESGQLRNPHRIPSSGMTSYYILNTENFIPSYDFERRMFESFKKWKRNKIINEL